MRCCSEKSNVFVMLFVYEAHKVETSWKLTIVNSVLLCFPLSNFP